MTADELLDAPVSADAVLDAPQMSADAWLDTPVGPGAGAPVLGNGRNGKDGFSAELNVSGGPVADLPGQSLVQKPDGFSVDMGAESATALRDRVVGEQLAVDDALLNRNVFKPGSVPWRVVDGEMIVDPARFKYAADEMWKAGLLDGQRYAKMLDAAPDVERALAERQDLERRAGSQPELKAALEGAGVAGAAIAGGMASGAMAGRVLAGAPKPVALGGTLLAGAAGAIASGAAADAAVEEVAKHNAAVDSLLAAKELKPGWNMAGSLATIAVPVPGALRNVATAINTLRAERGAAEATKFAAAVLGGGAAFGGVVDAASQLAHQKIFDGMHPELQPMLRAELERRAAAEGKALEKRPEFSPASVGISTALGALTAGMGVKARNKVYAPGELVALEERVLAGRGSREEVQDFDVMRRAVLTMRNDEGLLAADGVRRATVDVYGSPVLDVTEIVRPEFRKAALRDSGMGRAGNVALVESNPNPRAGVPAVGGAPVYQGQNFIDRGGPGPVFAGGEMALNGAAGVAGALPEGRLATPLAPEVVPSPAVSADDLLDGKVAVDPVSSWDRLKWSIARAQADGQIPYIEVKRELGEGRSEMVAFDLDGKEIAKAKAITGLSKLFSRRKDTYRNVAGGFHTLAKGEDFSLGWLKGKMDGTDGKNGSDVPSPAAVPVVTEPEVKAVAAEVKAPEAVKQSKPVDTAAMRGQKKFLLSEIDKVMADAPDMNWRKVALEARPDLGVELADLAKQRAQIHFYNTGPEATAERMRIKGREDAIEKELMRATPKVTIQVPGDGVFTIYNSREALVEFADRAKKFPTTAAKADVPSRGMRQEPTGIAPLKKGKPEDLLVAARRFASQDATRWVLNHFYQDGSATAATDGRRLLVTPGADKPAGAITFTNNSGDKHWMLHGTTGKPMGIFDGTFPDWRQVVPNRDNMVPVAEMDTGRVLGILHQAHALFSGAENPLPTVWVTLNKDGSLGFESKQVAETREEGGKMEPVGESYAHNVQPDSFALGAYNIPFLIDSLAAMRAAGNATARMYVERKDSAMSPMVIENGRAFTVLMPMRVVGSEGGRNIETPEPKLPGTWKEYWPARSGSGPVKKARRSKVMADMGPGEPAAVPRNDGLLFDVPAEVPVPVAGGKDYTSDAQVYADFPDAVGVYEDRGGWRMPIILGATDRVPVVEMPEIVEFYRAMTGTELLVKKNLGKALGDFLAGRVRMRADLAHDEKSALMTLMHEIGHGIHWLDDGVMARGNILGIIAGLVGHMGHAIPAVPGLDPVGVEGWGYSGKAISTAERAEIRRRAEEDLVNSLVGEVRRITIEQPIWAESGVTVDMVKGMFGLEARENWPEMYNWFARQDGATKKAIVLAAMRGAVDPRLDHLKSRVQVGTERVETEVNTGRVPTGDELLAAFDNALRAEMHARNIVDLKYVRDELLAVSRWWKPYPSGADERYRKYRESGAELYADAMSVLLNSPADLQSRAPIFWDAWWNYLDARPAVKAKLLEVQGRILSGKVAVFAKREELAKGAMARGAEIFLRKQAEATARRTQLAGWWEDLKDQYWDKYYPLTSAAARARADGKITRAEEDGIRWMLEEHPMADTMLQLKMADIGRIYHRLDDARIPRFDLGFLMKLQRIANERIVLGEDPETGEVQVTGRSVMFNPGGETARTAQEQLDHLRTTWGEVKWRTVTGAAEDFRAIFLGVMREGYEAGLYSDDTWGRIEGNADVYATFTPVEYVQEFLPAAIKKQLGTFKEIADPVQQTTLKMVAVYRAARNNRFIRRAVEEVQRVLPEAVRTAPMRYDGKKMVPQVPKETGWRLVTWMEGGQVQGVHMLERYARMWERQSPAARDGILRLLQAGFSNTIYSAIIRYNPAFQLFMSPVRDLQRSVTNMPGGVKGRGLFVARLLDPQVWGASVDWARGDVGRSALMREMMEASAVGGPHTAFGGRMGVADDALDGMLKKFHVQNDHKWRGRALSALLSPFRAIEFAGQTLQMLPKAAAYKVMARDLGWERAQAANMIRNHIGIPNYYKKGRHVSQAGALVPFLNIFLRGYDSMARMGRGAERGQSAGAFWLAWLLTGGGLVTVLQTLAREGMMGDDLRRMYERIPEWDMTNYMNLVLGEVPTGALGGKTVYVRLPMDEGLRVVNATVHKSLTAAIRAARGDKVKPGLGDVATGVTATVPGVNPLISVASSWNTFMQGQNPRDNFRNRTILTEDEWRAGGWPAVSKMMGWTLTQTGITNFFTYDREADTTTEMVIGSTPVVNRMLKVTDRGTMQTIEDQKRADDAVMARVRAVLPEQVIALREEYYHLQKWGDRMSNDQMNRYGELSLWMKIYRRALGDVETSLEMQDPNAAAEALRELREATKEYRAR